MITKNVVAGFVTGTVALGASVAVGERTAFAVLLGLTCVGLAIGRWRGRDRSRPVSRTAAAVSGRAGRAPWRAVAGRRWRGPPPWCADPWRRRGVDPCDRRARRGSLPHDADAAEDGRGHTASGITSPGGRGRWWVRRVQRGPLPVAHDGRRGGDRPGQPDQLLPLPAAAARGGERRPRTPADLGLAGRHAAASVHPRPGEVDELDLAQRTVRWIDPEGGRHSSTYDRLVLAVGSVHKLMPIPGLSEFAHGFRGIPEALYMRDHLIRQIALAAATDDPRERGPLHLRRRRRGLHRHRGDRPGPAVHPRSCAPARLGGDDVRWCCSSAAVRCSPGSTSTSRATADRVLRERGVEVRTGESVEEATADGVRLTPASTCRRARWCGASVSAPTR